MMRILMILALCTLPTAPRAQTELTPWLFDLQSQFNDCLNAASGDHSHSCHAVLKAGFTLRREIGNALDACLTTNADGCVSAFNNAGFPAERLNIATLPPCTLLGKLGETDITYLPEDSCIEHIARTVERHDIPTSHNSDISCGRSYVSCAEIIGMGTRYWESAVWLLHQEKLDTVLGAAVFTDPVASHRHFSLLERQMQQRIDLAETSCNIQMMMPRAKTLVYEGCMGDAYADMWQTLKHGGDD